MFFFIIPYSNKYLNLGCAYINERMLRIRKLRWKAGGRLAENVKANLSEHELKWLNKYNELILNFQNEFGDEENENDGFY